VAGNPLAPLKGELKTKGLFYNRFLICIEIILKFFKTWFNYFLNYAAENIELRFPFRGAGV
jgi:hypothetical protein